MATFRVGQRVRIKHSHYWPELKDQEGVIYGTGFIGTRDSPDYGKPAWLVKPDSWKENHAISQMDGKPHKFGATPGQLEPLQPEGYKVVSWEKCLWKPEHLRKQAS